MVEAAMRSQMAEATVRRYVRESKQKLGLTGRETFVPQVYDWVGSEGRRSNCPDCQG
jgi:hypothetical protein